MVGEVKQTLSFTWENRKINHYNFFVRKKEGEGRWQHQ